MKILTVVGARPQFIKAAVVSRALSQHAAISETLVHTGQHYDDAMSQIFFRELDMLRPAVNLGIGGGMHGNQTGRMLVALEEVMVEHSPDWVLVYGDTNSTLAGALCAAKLNIPLAHVEAGLRSFDRSMPEEVNRVVADAVANLLFAPTFAARDNLSREGVTPDKILVTGDVMYDAAILYRDKAAQQSNIIKRLGLLPGKYVLATVHRAATTDSPDLLRAVIEGLIKVAREIPVVLPLHPRTRKILEATPDLSAGPIALIEPVGYLDMLRLESNAAVVATDSGGVQKEAFYFRVPCVTLRSTSEWGELEELGWNVLVNPALGPRIISGEILDAKGRKGREGNPYGTGHAAAAIASALVAGPSAWHDPHLL